MTSTAYLSKLRPWTQNDAIRNNYFEQLERIIAQLATSEDVQLDPLWFEFPVVGTVATEVPAELQAFSSLQRQESIKEALNYELAEMRGLVASLQRRISELEDYVHVV